MHQLGDLCRHHQSGHFRYRRTWSTSRTDPPDLLVLWNVQECMDVRVGDWSDRVDAGALVVFPPGLPHHYRPVPETGWEWLWLHVGGLAASAVAAVLSEHGPVIGLGEHPRLRARFLELVTASAAAGPEPTAAEQLHLDSCAFSILGLIAVRAGERAERPGAEVPPDLEPFVAWVDDHLADPVTLPDLARAAGWSTATLHRLARRHLGDSPMGYLTRRRMIEAARLLADTDLTVGEIARRVGFPDPLHFSRRYRRWYGRPPSAARGDVPGAGPGRPLGGGPRAVPAEFTPG